MAHSLTDSGRELRALTPCQRKAQRHRPRSDGPAGKGRSAQTKTRAEVRGAAAAAGRTRRAATGSAGRTGGPARATRPAAPGRQPRARWRFRRLRLRGPACRDVAGAGRGTGAGSRSLRGCQGDGDTTWRAEGRAGRCSAVGRAPGRSLAHPETRRRAQDEQ